MICFLTSSPVTEDRSQLNPANGFTDNLRAALPSPCRGLFLCSDPDSPARTDAFAAAVRAAFIESGFTFAAFRVLDRRNQSEAARLAAEADLMILSGGHVPTQNRFFQEIDLRRALQSFEGVLLGISAGSMNAAETVYAHPEEPGEAVSPDYRRFLPGLGLTRSMVIPHYQAIKDDVLDGLRVFEDIAYPDSMGRRFLVLEDGSYILIRGGSETVYGKAYLIEDGVFRGFCEAGNQRELS